MSLFKTILAFVQFFAFIGYGVTMKHAILKRKTGQYLPDSVITTKYAESELECSMHCTSIDACLSVNYKASGVDQGLCQLNNRTTSENLGLVSDDKFVHLSIVKRVRILSMQCKQCMKYSRIRLWVNIWPSITRLNYNVEGFCRWKFRV